MRVLARVRVCVRAFFVLFVLVCYLRVFYMQDVKEILGIRRAETFKSSFNRPNLVYVLI